MERGTVIRWNDSRGFGFIKRPGMRDLFFHVTSVIGNDDQLAIQPGVSVTFEVKEGSKGPFASNVAVLQEVRP